MGDLEAAVLQARMERLASRAEPYLAGFYAAIGASALCLMILPAIAVAIRSTL